MRPGFGPSHSGRLNGKTCKRAAWAASCVLFLLLLFVDEMKRMASRWPGGRGRGRFRESFVVILRPTDQPRMAHRGSERP